MKFTKNYHLPQWSEDDLILMEEFNTMNQNIENGIDGAKAEAKADSEEAKSIANSAKTTANAAKAAADTALAAKPYVVGSYTGRDADQTVYLGFRPRFLIVTGMTHHIGNAPTEQTNYTVMTGGNVMADHIQFTDTGFVAKRNSGWAPTMTVSSRRYDYIAFK